MDYLEERSIPIPDIHGLEEDEEEDNIPSSTPSSQTSSPKTIQRLTHSIQEINAKIQRYGGEMDKISKDFSSQVQKTLRGSQMQAELGAIRGEELEKHLQAKNNQRRPRSCRWVPGLSTTGILSVKDCNRRIDHWKVEEMEKSRRKVLWEREKEEAKKEAEKAEYAKLEADIQNPAINSSIDDLFRYQFGLDSFR